MRTLDRLTAFLIGFALITLAWASYEFVMLQIEYHHYVESLNG